MSQNLLSAAVVIGALRVITMYVVSFISSGAGKYYFFHIWFAKDTFLCIYIDWFFYIIDITDVWY